MDDPSLLLIEGERQTLKVVFIPQNATNKNVTWKSHDESVVTVSQNGEVEAIAEGVTFITATTEEGGKVARCDVEVIKPLVSVISVTLDPSSLEMMVGERKSLTPVFNPANATVKAVSWESLDPTKAIVNENGEVEAVSIGDTRIKVTTTDGKKVAYCDVSIDASEFKVDFETNGGNTIGSVTVPKGDVLTAPAPPTKQGGATEGLYEGVIDPDAGSFTFDVWCTDTELTNPYDFTRPVTNNLTLYARWATVGTLPTPIDLSKVTGSNIVERSWNYLNALALDAPAEYTLLLASDVNVSGNLTAFKNANVSLHFVGKGEERVINRSINGNLFIIEDAGTFTFGENITITGTPGNYHLIAQQTGTSAVIMKAGAKITDAVGTGPALIMMNSGSASFTMEGGEISGNKMTRSAANYVAGVIAVNWGKFYMKGGVISGNSASTPFNTTASHFVAGAVLLRGNQTFQKTGGEIKDNTAEITADEEPVAKTGQQIFLGLGDNNAANWRKVDANLGVTDNLSNSDTGTNPLWKPVP